MSVSRLTAAALSLAVCAATSIARPADAPASAPASPPGETPAARDARLAWWREARFGLFIHWGPVSLKGTEIGWSRGEAVPRDVYDDLYKDFDPVRFDAGEWVGIAKEAGARYLVLVAKHHDGFAMFDTRHGEHKVTRSPFGRDVARELADECKRQGVRFATYYSIIDWYHPDYLPRGHGGPGFDPGRRPDFDRYVAFLRDQVAEIVEKYDPGILWFDGEWEDRWTVERGREIYRFLRAKKPSIIVNNRLGKDRGFLKGGFSPPEKTVGDYATPEQEAGRLYEDRSIAWESCVTIGEQWAWKPKDKLKSVAECLDLVIRSAGLDGNLLLNVGPMPDGRIEPRQVERLREMGKWLSRYCDTIYGTRGGPYRPAKWGVSTLKGKSIFLHILSPAGGGRLDLPSPPGKKVVKAEALTGGKAAVKEEGAKVRIEVRPEDLREIDTIVELELDGPAIEVPFLDGEA